MITGLYSGAAAIDAHQKRHEVVAANLANASTPGYRRRLERFTSVENQFAKLQGRGVPITKFAINLDFTPADVVHTGNTMDVAIVQNVTNDGNAFFALGDSNGQEVYTRAGKFALGSDGRIIHASTGYSVLQPNGAPININPTGGAITIDDRGSIFQDGQTLGNLKIVRFSKLDTVRPSSFGILNPGPQNRVESAEGMVEVRQGHLELSNTNSIDELVNMITNYRSYEASQKVVKQVDQSIKTLIRQTGI